MSNDERIAAWRHKKLVLFSLPIVDESIHQAVDVYRLRRLSRGQVPNVSTVESALNGSAPIPACGYLGCPVEDEHVH